MIGYYVHHHGLGHLTRMQAVARHLRTPVTGLSSLPAPAGWGSDWVHLERDDLTPQHDSTDSDATAHGRLHWVPRHDPGLSGRAAAVAAWVERARPALVVVDVSVEIAVLTRLCGVPVVVLAMPGTRTDPAHALAYDLADGLLAPWPAAAHTTDWPAHWHEKLWPVGGISRFDGRVPARRRTSSAGETGARRVLVLWGGGGRATSGAELRAARAATPGWEWVERSPAAPSTDLWDDLQASDVVVTHGGQNAVAEVAAARRPAVVVAQPRPFDEQVATAEALDRLGIAVGVSSWPRGDDWPALLGRALDHGGEGWRRWSTGRGAAAAAARLDALAADLTAVDLADRTAS